VPAYRRGRPAVCWHASV